MEQLLPRGFLVSPEIRIRRMAASGSDWQIYLTNVDSYVLAVKPSLYSLWITEYSLPDSLFSDEIASGYMVFLGSGNNMISSLGKGPYPKNSGQIEAFSIAFKTAFDSFSNVNVQDAIYIEEYSLILPSSFGSAAEDTSVAYGRWLTGGINVSIHSLDRVSKIMSWMPKELLEKSAHIAGFDFSEEESENKQDPEMVYDSTVIPDHPFDSNEEFHLIGRPALEQFFNDNIIDIVLHQEQYKRMGISFPGATILYGPPGCGKTYAVERLAEYLGWERFDIDSSTIASSYIHDTSKKISEVFQAAINAAPSILVIDEMEAFLSDRGMAGPSGMHHVEEVAEFLRRIPEAISKGVLIFAMTNMIDSIDPAILRRGRFDHIVEVKMASKEEIAALLEARFQELPIDESVNADEIAAQLAGHPLSDVSFVIREAGRFAVKQNLNMISKNCFTQALNMLPKKKEQNKIGFGN